VFSWGDSRPGNIIYDGTRCACLTDFENASMAPPEMDLGWWLHFDRTMHEGVSAPRLAGEPTRAEQCELYARASARHLGDVHWFEVFAAVRYAMIVVRVVNRSVDQGRVPANNEAWLHNSIVDCLSQVLDE
jgi:aminoglycoside phosphotransferase (APT) family kinase protein